jgi:hypothetical protein
MKLLFKTLILGITFFSLSSCFNNDDELPPVAITKEIFLDLDTVIISQNNFTQIVVRTDQGVIPYQIFNVPFWLSVTPISGFITSDNTTFIGFSLNILGPNFQNTSADIEINTVLGNKKIHVVAVKPVTPEFLDLNVNVDSQILTIFNVESNTTNFEIITRDEFLTISEKKGILKIGESKKITVSKNIDKLPEGFTVTFITVKLNAKVFEIQASIYNFRPGTKIDRDVVDGQYVDQIKKFVFISEKPKSVNILDPITSEIRSLNISYVPTCMTIIEDGRKLIVGHDARVTTYDLTNLTFQKEYALDCYASYIAANSKNIYVFPPNQQQNFKLRRIDLLNGKLQSHIFENLNGEIEGKVHKNENWLYLTIKGLFNVIHKIDISSATPRYLYAAEPFSSAFFTPRIYMTKDGKRLLAGRTFLSTTPTQDSDMVYSGILDFEKNGIKSNGIQYVSESIDNKSLFIKPISLDASMDGIIYQFDLTSFELLNTFNAGFFSGNGAIENTKAQFSFQHEDKVYIIVSNINETNWEIKNFRL